MSSNKKGMSSGGASTMHKSSSQRGGVKSSAAAASSSSSAPAAEPERSSKRGSVKSQPISTAVKGKGTSKEKNRAAQAASSRDKRDAKLAAARDADDAAAASSSPSSPSPDEPSAASSSRSTTATAAATPAAAAASGSPVATVIPPNRIGLTHMSSLLTAKECDEVIALQNTYARSPLFHNGVQSHWVLQIPTQPSLELSPLIARLQQRMMAAPCWAGLSSKLSPKNAWLIAYPAGVHATAHTDGAQALTCLVYLNSVAAGQGGQTHFTRLGAKFQPTQGHAIFWRTVEADGLTTIMQSEHEGLPCEQVKYVLNCGFELMS